MMPSASVRRLVMLVVLLAICGLGCPGNDGNSEGEGEGIAEGEGAPNFEGEGGPPAEGEPSSEGEGSGGAEGEEEGAAPATTRQFTLEVLNVFPHDTEAFTQGLVLDGATLYEGTGLEGRSTLRRVDLKTGYVEQSIALASRYFGEGITVFGDKIIQLTLESHIGFVYDKDSFDLLQDFSYDTDGWGITHDGNRLIMSDGTAMLYFLDPVTFQLLDSVEVLDLEGNRIVRLNELEFIDGEVYANIWLTDSIAIINPDSGTVTGWIDATGLLEPGEVTSSNAVLNGIAFDSDTNHLLITGKLWPKLFEVRLMPVDP